MMQVEPDEAANDRGNREVDGVWRDNGLRDGHTLYQMLDQSYQNKGEDQTLLYLWIPMSTYVAPPTSIRFILRTI